MEVTQEMLNAAMKAAVQAGIAPKYADQETYLRHWDGMKAALVAALKATEEG